MTNRMGLLEAHDGKLPEYVSDTFLDNERKQSDEVSSSSVVGFSVFSRLFKVLTMEQLL